ncbi:MAG: hypothetical protein Q4B82_07320 [Alysiella sp.]|uniref:hypothetical protein n=1 Tax=Alysiella sp. TaxID=1872483 RepID=UPI0026DB240D|nr:hypothetical protein [Alysiella sp.]MDO4434371.1 hypothetical protein [Alysiella sp.]
MRSKPKPQQLSLSLNQKRHRPPLARFLPLNLRHADDESQEPHKQTISSAWDIHYDELDDVALYCDEQYVGQSLSVENAISLVQVNDVSHCLSIQSLDLQMAVQTHQSIWQDPLHISGCLKNPSAGLKNINPSIQGIWQSSVSQNIRASLKHSAIEAQYTCHTQKTTLSVCLKTCLHWQYTGHDVHSCQNTQTGFAPQAPCEWYPIVLSPSKDHKKRPCGNKPQSNRVKLNLTRRKLPMSPKNLPLPLSCNVDFKQIPPLDTYMILNKITAKSGEIELNPLSASAKADMNGYCWLCELTLPPDEFFKLGLEQTQLGQEKIIELKINDDVFVFMAENISDNRKFAQRNYTISGRSLTAKLGADYALGRQGVIEQDLYASQIAQQQVADLGFSLEWQTVDWLIPSNTYTQTDKSPIAVIMDLAQACGAFVYSHPSEPKLFVLPKWREAAWNVPTASPALIVPSNIILQISGQKNVQTQAHGVFVFGTGQSAKAAHVTRHGTDGLPETSALSHSVYTDLIACEAAGIAALSETGTHKSETITLPVAKKYNLGIAEMGRVWRFNEPNGAWNAVIQGVSVSVSVEGDVPVVKQTVSADRYLGS